MQSPGTPQWQQLNIMFAGGRDAAEHHALTAIAPVLAAAEDDALITGWWFTRKPWWRIRYLPASDGTAAQAARHLETAATQLQASGHVRRWAPGIYEPETRAFGGPAGMAVAHRLFHADSRAILTLLAPHAEPCETGRRRELSLLLCTALMRGAGQDQFERGDVWAKVCDLRTPSADAEPAQWAAFRSAVTRLITVDTSPGTALRAGSLRHVGAWLASFETSGRELRALADEGCLERGIRAVIAHHVIFHWNRIGLPGPAQASLARAAAQAIFG